MYTMNRWLQIETVFAREEEISLTRRVLLNIPSMLAISMSFVMLSSVRVSNPSVRMLTNVFIAVLVLGSLTATLRIIVGDTIIRYAVADLFRFVIPWFSLYAFYRACSVLSPLDSSNIKFFRIVFYALIALFVADAFATIYISAMFPWAKISTVAYISLVFYGVFFFFHRPYLASVCLVLGLTALLVAGKRGNLLAAPLSVFAVMFLYLVTRSRSSVKASSKFEQMKVGIGSMIAIAFSVFFLIYLSSLEQFSTRGLSVLSDFTDTIEGIFLSGSLANDQSMAGRVNENLNIIEFFYSHPWYVLFGAGFGAEVEMRYVSGVYSISGGMHHAHMAWAVYFLRNGVLGLILLAGFFYVVTLLLWRQLKQVRNPYSGLALCLLVFFLILSFKSNFLLERAPLEIVVFFFLAREMMVKATSRSKGVAAQP